MRYHVSELVELDELQTLMDALHRATGINHALLDTEGNVLTAAGWQRCCTDFHRAHPESRKRCEVSDQYILQHLHDGPYVSYECLNGLFEYAIPVMIGGAHVATIFTGQLLHRPPDVDRFTKQAIEFSFNKEEYLAAIESIEIVPQERMPDVMHFLVGLAESLSKSGLARLKQLEANAELETAVHSRTAELERTVDLLQAEINARNVVEQALRQSQSELRQLAADQVRIKEDERKRIAREIHDELGQTLLALRLDVSSLHARTGASHPRLHDRCAATLQSIDSTIRTVKAIINDLRPPVLDLGLAAAIEWLVAQFRFRSGIECKLVMDEKTPELNDESTTAVFRIVQESLTNIHRHAQANLVEIALSVRNAAFIMTISDDGIGIQPEGRRKANAYGLLGMNERVRIIGGQLSIDAIPGGGTCLCVSIPLGGPLARDQVVQSGLME
ncbi:MAG TPA: PocR ligand-binding domain-containing protein [Noviherbaspirillum sp.]|uniref:PocR ligand-binding domain-containing protein n=1 Tax=Noviherbaspirillum sp. TaxID=1926288 RepID=UPI002D5B67EC|nr:PocR ligand-binding domain-containing protein [Noviherbaspirillum sp.]HYD95286.1 PocR ligand-binding domain-containing protein [Noviherbaspirillum sp.]